MAYGFQNISHYPCLVGFMTFDGSSKNSPYVPSITRNFVCCATLLGNAMIDCRHLIFNLPIALQEAQSTANESSHFSSD